jgi:Glycosyl transferase family 2/Glycosyl transferases group 1
VRSLARRAIRRLRRSRVFAVLAPSARPAVARRVVSASGLFDRHWYAGEMGELPGDVDPLEHFLRVGGPAGVSPSPLFLSEWYLAHRPAGRRARFGPFVDYLVAGARTKTSPHPLLSVDHYLRALPEARRHPLGALGHYLDVGWRADVSPHPELDVGQWARTHPGTEEPPLVALARQGGELIRQTRGTEHHPRTVDWFDHAAADRFVARIRSGSRVTPGDPPLVTVVVPTRNRAGSVVEAVRSVFAQTFPHWQLVVSDDGSTDGTEEALAPILADERVELVRSDTPGGVSAARNAGLARARGTYVAYLDSDNTWVPHYLEVMVGVLRSTPARAAYAVSELRERTGRRRVVWRAAPFDRAALVDRNYIDCIAVVHERSLLDEVGMFDQSLRRGVDWDLWIRMSAVTDFVHAPFVATVYDPWDDTDDRITTSVPIGFRNAVIAKHLVDWDAERTRSRDPELLSVIIPAVGHSDDLVAQVRRLAEVTVGRWEVVLVDPAGDAERLFRLLLLQEQLSHVRLERIARRLPPELALDVGIASSHGGEIVLLGAGVRVVRGWESPLRAAIRDGAVAAQGLLLQPDGTVASAGIAFTDSGIGHPLLAGVPGDAPEALVPGTRSALTAQFLAATAADLLAVHGFDGLFVDDLGNGDLSLRLTDLARRPLAYVPAAVASLPRSTVDAAEDVPPRVAEDNRRIFVERWAGRLPVDAAQRWASMGYDLIGLATTGRAQVIRRRDRRPPRWAIKVGPPTVARRESWGDWHFALALKAALERLGQEVVVDCRDAWYRDTTGDDDIALVLRGVTAYEPDSRHVNLLWVISHPEQVSLDEASAFDHVFAASEPWAGDVSSRYGVPVEPLLQCVDPARFHPVEPDPARRHPVLFVGNARGVRPSVAAARDAGLAVAVYGLRWEGLLPPGWWQGTYVPNAELPALYRAAGVVLNDHWDDMKAHGFLSNRLFDLVACAARIVTDDVVGLADVFGSSVLTYDTPSSMADAVRMLADEGPAEAAEREGLSLRVRHDHSFDARAARLIEVAASLRDSHRVRAVSGP